MENIIGLGAVGCGIAKEFSEYPEYEVYYIDARIDQENSYSLGKHTTIEEYEEAVSSTEVKKLFAKIQKQSHCMFVLGGGENISGATLRILREVSDSPITILYICPDGSTASSSELWNHKITMGILQQYARSGLFRRMFLISREMVEERLGDIPISLYEKSVHELVASTVSLVNYFDHVEPVMSNRSVPTDISRIATFATSPDIEGGSYVYLYDLKGVNNIHYYYGIPMGKLENDTSIRRSIKQEIKTARTSNPGVDISFSIYGTTFTDPVSIICAYSPIIQEEPERSLPDGVSLPEV
jgi:hypothetical protein